MFLAPTRIITVLLSLGGLNSYLTGKIESNENVVFFPTFATEFNSTHLHAPVHGWIFEPKVQSKKRAALISLLKNVLEISDESQQSFLDQRVRPFVVDNQSLKRIKILLGGKYYRLPLSGKNGHFETTLVIPKNHMQRIEKDESGFIHFRAVTGEHDNRIFEGAIQIVSPKGFSVISDIDDTIKVTEVWKGKKTLMENSFLKDFKAVPGMASVYQKWQSQSDNISFHYVSSSVYQLYEDLEDFRMKAGFPPATFHLKTIRPKNLPSTLSKIAADPLETKSVAIESILRRLPWRSFVLVGDSGEKDPEVYAEIAKRHPSQVSAIFIRNVNNATNSSRFNGLSSDKWAFFDDATDLLEKSERLLCYNIK